MDFYSRSAHEVQRPRMLFNLDKCVSVSLSLYIYIYIHTLAFVQLGRENALDENHTMDHQQTGLDDEDSQSTRSLRIRRGPLPDPTSSHIRRCLLWPWKHKIFHPYPTHLFFFYSPLHRPPVYLSTPTSPTCSFIQFLRVLYTVGMGGEEKMRNLTGTNPNSVTFDLLTHFFVKFMKWVTLWKWLWKEYVNTVTDESKFSEFRPSSIRQVW